ncbi:MAG: phosphohydrolase [Hyphococcus sp.]|nr:MAG: phosphohydrolase [Marinicaulis sp.]
MIDLSPLEWIKLAIYYASYLYFPAAMILFWGLYRWRGTKRIAVAMVLLCLSLIAYGRFIEPRILLTVEHDVLIDECFDEGGAFRVAVFSDTHNGLFGNAMPINRIVNAVNKANADFVLVPGDFIYFLNPDRFDQMFDALPNIKAPVFAVLGNHDLGLPGPDLSKPLRQALPGFDVRLIDDQPLKLSNSQFAIELVGLSDQWARAQDLSLLEKSTDLPRIVLTHNPASVNGFSSAMRADLLVGGHTHGGQIQLPFLTCALTGVCGDIAYGLREDRGVQIFTTSGTGMVGLPMRFRVPPRVDVLNVRYKACASG